MEFTFTVTVSVERSEGKFATRDEIEAQIQEALEGADPGSYDGENGGTYETSSWEVNVEEQPKRVRRAVIAKARRTGSGPARVDRNEQGFTDMLDRAQAAAKERTHGDDGPRALREMFRLGDA